MYIKYCCELFKIKCDSVRCDVKRDYKSRHFEGFTYDKVLHMWYVCSGGFVVLKDIKFCPFCGEKLEPAIERRFQWCW